MKKVPVTYDPSKIESKWQKKWLKDKTYSSKEDAKKSKYYVLDMFPYPSGEGLHVGHPKGYIATDIVSRFQRMHGKSVLHPMGFDAFGLPAENYALKTKTNPIDSVATNVARFKKQLEIIGLDYDWSREINTTDPAYYKWTQWIFLELFKKGLAYESFEPINWCPVDKTGLANEDVENGRCERCGALVEKKPMRQWVLKITDYAERLLTDLDARNTSGVPLIVRTTGDDAIRKDLPFIERDPVVCVIKHWSEDKYLCINWKANHWQGFVIGGIEEGESPADAAIREIKEETGYQNIKFVREIGKVDSQFYQAVKKVNRFAHFTGVYVELVNDNKVEISEDEKKLHDLVWVSKNEMETFITHEDMRYIWDLFIGAKKQEIKPLLDWPNSIKEAQKNWIGKSEGAEINFKIKSSNKEIKVFTTRPDTLFGVTYVVLAPEHAFVNELLSSISNKAEVEAYVERSKNETEIERTDARKEKTGVELKGIKAINPANNEEVPVWIADYVLADYGTGAVMAVPAHDDRDWDFAKKFNLQIKDVIVPTFGEPNPKAEKTEGSAVIIFDKKTGLYGCLHWQNPELYTLVTGGRNGNESFEDTAKRELAEETGITKVISWHKLGNDIFCNYYSPAKHVFKSAHSLQFLAIVNSDEIGEHKREEYEKFDVEWKSVEDLMILFEKTVPKSRHFFEILARGAFKLNELGLDKKTDLKKMDFIKTIPFTEDGVLINSASFSGKSSDSVKKDITLSVGGKWVTKYKLRDWVFSRQRYWGEPIPLIHCEKCGVVPVPEDELPVKLPKVKSYEPTGTGESPLAAIDKWVNVKCPKCKGKAKRETNTMPQWAGSSWYYLRYMDPKNKKAFVDPKKEKYWAPVNLYVGGAEHATRHLIYARFWHKFLYDIGAVSTTEPFIKLQNVGLIMGEDGRKMSKRFGNVVNPDDIVKNYGADSLRLYEMFMGPFDQSIAWSTSSIVGVRRFIEKVWRLREKNEVINTWSNKGEQVQNNFDKVLHKAIKKVTEDINSLSFNTAISTLMIAVNELENVAIKENNSANLSRSQFEILLKLIAPFAPHVAEELWYSLGNKKSIHISDWPIFDEKLIIDNEVNIIVQVNGKVRASFKAQTDSTEAQLEATAKEIPEVKKWLEGKSVKKVIVVKGKLVSLVVA